MKWIGQHIWDYISRFRSDVYLEDISTGTIASGGNLGLDSNNKIVKAAEVGSAVDLTSEVTGVLPVANGGSGASSLADNSVLTGTGTSAITAESSLTYTGEVLQIGDDDTGLAVLGRRAHSDGAGGTLGLFAGSATVGQTNQNGGNLALYGGQPTGSGTFGDIEFYSGYTTSSGTALRSSSKIGLLASNAATSTDFYLYEKSGASGDDYLKISVAEHGATTLTTVDAAAHAADITITADGDAEIAADVITLDSAANIELEVGATSNYVGTTGIFRGGNIGPVSDTFIPLMPVDFITASSYRFVGQIDTPSNGKTMTPSSASAFYFCQKIIPKGYTANTFRVNGVDGGSNASTFTVYENTIAGATPVASTLAFAFNTDQAVIGGKEIVGDGEKFATIVFNPGDTSDLIYGGKITITKTT